MLDPLFDNVPSPQVRTLGRSIFDPIWREKEHAGRHAELLHVLQGNVRLEMRGCAIDGSVGDTILTPTGMPHRDVFPPGSTFEVYIVQFEWAGEKVMFDHFTPVELSNLSATAKARIAADFRQMYDDFRRGGALAKRLTNLRLEQILLTMCREAAQATNADTAPQDRAQQIMEAARRIIHERYHEPLTLDDIADAVNVSPYHLSHVFSAESGFTLSNYLTTVRMEAAAARIAPGVKVSDVAAAVGFRDPQYFSRVFSAHFGMPPSRYRR